MTSIVCVPENQTRIGLGGSGLEEVTVQGVAWAGGGRGVCRVEVSLDGGVTWEPCEMNHSENQDRCCSKCGDCDCAGPDMGTTEASIARLQKKPTPEMGIGRQYAWTQYTRAAKILDSVKDRLKHGEAVELEIVCKALDGDMNQQPEKMRDNWNVLGIAVNHWHRVHVTLDPNLPANTKTVPPKPPGPGKYPDTFVLASF